MQQGPMHVIQDLEIPSRDFSPLIMNISKAGELTAYFLGRGNFSESLDRRTP
jgi:hypothetical protein